MNGVVIAPVALPLLAGALMLVLNRHSRWVVTLSWLQCLLGLLLALHLVGLADDGVVRVHLAGNWPPPFGIAFALDRLSALMVLLTAVLGLAVVSYAKGSTVARTPYFHPFLAFQLAGLNGAFLTADLFNLFVWFEVLLIASYALMLAGASKRRVRAALVYVSFNLAGSALFLIAVALLYGLTGTLSIADMAQQIDALSGFQLALAQSAGLLLMVVFAIKAAILPWYFWLPLTYSSAAGVVAALFAIMTKVGIYALLRVHLSAFGDGPMLGSVLTLLEPLGVATLLFAAIGAVAASDLRRLTAYLVVGSAGMLITVLAANTPEATAAALYYLVQSTLLVGGVFLLADLICQARGPASSDLALDAPIAHGALLGSAFFIAMIAAVGLPPLAGFIAKLALLNAIFATPGGAGVVVAILVSSLLMLIAMARAFSQLFWTPAQLADTAPSPPISLHPWPMATMWLLVLSAVLLAGYADAVLDYTTAIADQLQSAETYHRAVLDAQPVPEP